MTEQKDQPAGTLSRRAVILMTVGAGALVLASLTGFSLFWVAAVMTVITEGGLAGLVVLSAGGYGNLLVRRIAPPSSPTALRVISAAALGLWMLGTAVLVVGSTFHGLLRGWFWWPVVGIGLVLAAIRGKKTLEAWRLPAKTDGRALLWVLLAVAAAIWFAGATMPPGLLPTADEYDVMEYHLQAPREFHHAQHIGRLNHNVYSFYPLGVEMLFLLGMCLRGGPYEGMYLAKMLHGSFGVMAAAAVFATLKREDEPRARISAGLLGTAPLAVYLSWLAMVELAVLAYLTLALLWLREWISDRSSRSAWCIGLRVGGSCAVKYLSVGFVAGPILGAVLVLALLSRERAKELPHVMIVGVATLALFAPWLIRNTVYTRNPVFPLATGIFGRGHWSAESEQRWVDGHGPEVKAPVPQPADWKDSPPVSRPTKFFYNFLSSEWFSPVMLLIAGVAICALLAEKGPPDRWNWSLVGVLGAQLAVWTAFTHEMPYRFLAPALAPIALLAGGVLGRLSRVEVNPFKRGAVRPAGGPWGLVPAVVIFAAAAGVNLLIAYGICMQCTMRTGPAHGQPGAALQMVSILKEGYKVDLGQSPRLLLIGDAKAFYFPADTVYATAFDAHPLAEMIDEGRTPRDILEDLQSRGVTHVWANWVEIWRLAMTYGYPSSLSADLFHCRRTNRQPTLKVLDDLSRLGARRVKDIFPTTAPAEEQINQGVWPSISIYALPGVGGTTTSAPAATTSATNRTTTTQSTPAPTTDR